MSDPALVQKIRGAADKYNVRSEIEYHLADYNFVVTTGSNFFDATTNTVGINVLLSDWNLLSAIAHEMGHEFQEHMPWLNGALAITSGDYDAYVEARIGRESAATTSDVLFTLINNPSAFWGDASTSTLDFGYVTVQQAQNAVDVAMFVAEGNTNSRQFRDTIDDQLKGNIRDNPTRMAEINSQSSEVWMQYYRDGFMNSTNVPLNPADTTINDEAIADQAGLALTFDALGDYDYVAVITNPDGSVGIVAIKDGEEAWTISVKAAGGGGLGDTGESGGHRSFVTEPTVALDTQSTGDDRMTKPAAMPNAAGGNESADFVTNSSAQLAQAMAAWNIGAAGEMSNTSNGYYQFTPIGATAAL